MRLIVLFMLKQVRGRGWHLHAHCGVRARRRLPGVLARCAAGGFARRHAAAGVFPGGQSPGSECSGVGAAKVLRGGRAKARAEGVCHPTSAAAGAGRNSFSSWDCPGTQGGFEAASVNAACCRVACTSVGRGCNKVEKLLDKE